jgi:hypothetical protein
VANRLRTPVPPPLTQMRRSRRTQTHHGRWLWEKTEQFFEDNVAKHRNLVKQSDNKRKSRSALASNLEQHGHRNKVAREAADASSLAGKMASLPQAYSEQMSVAMLRADLEVYSRLVQFLEPPADDLDMLNTWLNRNKRKGPLLISCRQLLRWLGRQDTSKIR